MKSCGDLIQDIGRYVGRPDAVYKERIRFNLNLAARAWTRQFPSPYSRRRIEILATGGAQQALPSDVDRPVWFMDSSNARGISPGTDWDRLYPSQLANATGGAVFEWQFDGIWPMTEHPEGAYKIVVTTSTTVTESFRVEGTILDSTASGGPLESRLSSLDYVSATTYTLPSLYERVTGIVRTTRNANYLTFKDALSATPRPIARIEPFELGSRYVWVRWLNVPPAATRILMEYIPVVPFLAEDGQPLPSYIPWEYLYWHSILQAAADMERTDLAKIAGGNLQEVVVNERQKVFGFGDADNMALPRGDDWDLIGVD